MKRYVIGVDFGTLSARAILLDVENAKIVAECTSAYKHGVMDRQLPNGKKLPDSFALQHPQDYIDSLSDSVKGVISSSEVDVSLIGGIGIDFTASTVLPIDDNGIPLAFYPEFADDPHAYVKLWKHHGAQAEADEFTAIAKAMGAKWLDIYGGTVSAEFMFPKILETARCSPKVYEKAHRFVEAGEWIDLLLTGKESRAAAFAGYKAFWNEESGYPSNDYLKAVDPILDGIIGTKISDKVLEVTGNAGTISEKGAELTGLAVGTHVSLAMLDAHAAMPALNITDNGNLMLILGTSACHIINSEQTTTVDGIFGRVKNGVIPNTLTYEAGQQCFGDAFDWYVSEAVPQYCVEEADKLGLSVHSYLTDKASESRIGESGVIALDWFNGNRSVLVNSRLSGMLLGLTVRTRPEEIYRALLEAASFGTKRIIDQFESNGNAVNTVTGAGGIANKTALLMQILADVINKPIKVCDTTQASALGSAIYASVAAGLFGDVIIAAKHLSAPAIKEFTPIVANVEAYKILYSEYLTLHDYFGKTNMVMERLSDMKKD